MRMSVASSTFFGELSIADSAVLDELLRSLRKEKRRREVERTVARYYSSLCDEEQAEDLSGVSSRWHSSPVTKFR
jgi:hypothetical protein